jgi:hypothetical protein
MGIRRDLYHALLNDFVEAGRSASAMIWFEALPKLRQKGLADKTEG